MIRRLQKADVDRVMDLWLDTNLKAHDFVSAAYWRSNFESVKKCCRRRKSMCMKLPKKYRVLSA